MQELALKTDYEINVVEPEYHKLPERFRDNKQIKLMNLEEALLAANLIVALVAHKEFKQIEPKKLVDKEVIYIANLEDHEVISASSLFRNQMRPCI